MAVEITFVRHGQTEGNAAGRWQGHTNGSLTALGRSQASRLGKRLARTDFDLVISSDLTRTVDTANALGRPIVTDERWREPFFGSWEDCTTAEVMADGSGGLAALMAGEDVAMGGGERLSEVMNRTREALDDVVARVDGNGRVAVVSHGMALLTLLSGLLETKRPSPLRLMSNTAISELVVDSDHLSLTRYNDDTHLGHSSEPHWGSSAGDVDLFLVRHGQTVSNIERRWQGHRNGHLNDEGVRQASLLASLFPSVDAIYASPLSRAADTAAAVADAQSLGVAHDDRLKEISFGKWEGLTRAEILDRYPEESRPFFEGVDVARGETGETFVEVRKRIGEALGAIAGSHPDQSVAVVAHGGVTRAWATDILGIPYERRNVLSILGNTGYARIAVGKRGPGIVAWNLAPHLEEH